MSRAIQKIVDDIKIYLQELKAALVGAGPGDPNPENV
jgi:hypothetical protein